MISQHQQMLKVRNDEFECLVAYTQLFNLLCLLLNLPLTNTTNTQAVKRGWTHIRIKPLIEVGLRKLINKYQFLHAFLFLLLAYQRMTWKPYRRDKLEDTEEWPKLKKVTCVSVCKRQTDGLIDQFHANVGPNHAHGD